MTHTPPSEAAASSQDLLTDTRARLDHLGVGSTVEKLRHAAREENRLRLHLSNIGSALAEAGQPHRHKGDEVERIRDLAGERDALRNAEFRGQNGRVFRLSSAEWESGDADGMPSSVGIFGSGDVGRGEVAYYERAAGGALTDEARTAVAAVRDLGPELAKAGIQVGPRCSHAEAVAQLRGERDWWREKCAASHHLIDGTNRIEGQIAAMLRAHGFCAVGGLASVRVAIASALTELARLRNECARDQVAKQQALLDEIARLFPGKGPLLDRVRRVAAAAEKRRNEVRDLISDDDVREVLRKAGAGSGFASGLALLERRPSYEFDPAEPIGSKVGPATGQPRTEVPVGPDGSGTLGGDKAVGLDGPVMFRMTDEQLSAQPPAGGVAKAMRGILGELAQDACSGTLVDLGEAFRRNMANAVDCLPSDGHPIDAGTIKIAIRNLHAAVSALAKVVERVGAHVN